MSSFPFLGGSSNGRSPSFDAGRAVNCFLEPAEGGQGRSPAVLYGTPGLAIWATLGGPVRGMIVFSPLVAIVVAGSSVWKIAPNATTTQIGNVDNLTTPASMASNGTTIMIGTGANGYFVDPAAGMVTQIVDDSFLGADSVSFDDGYFIWNKPSTGQFQISGIYATTIDGLDFATAEGDPDNLIALIVDHRELWLFGANSTEVWADAGGVDFPFQRIQGAFLEVGCAAAHSVAKLDNTVFWLTMDARGFGTVVRANGYAPQRISTHTVEFAIASYGTISDAIAYTYAQEGHSFYVLSFPSAGATWVFDVATSLWHERAWRDPATGALGRHRSNCQMQFAGMTLVGDWENGNIYRMDIDVFDDAGAEMPLIRVAPHITNGGNYAFVYALELMMQTGVGLPDESNPQAILDWSDDGGYSWSNQLPASIGIIGNRKARVRWLRLGMSRDRLFRVTITDPVRRVITDADIVSVAGKV